MTYEREQHRIIPDPDNPKLWAFEILYHDRQGNVVGGFKSSKEAQKAVLRRRKSLRAGR